MDWLFFPAQGKLFERPPVGMKGKDEDRYRSRQGITRQWEDHRPPANSSPGCFYRNRPEPSPGLTASDVADQGIPADVNGVRGNQRSTAAVI
ncbi:MAG: hypothetical protein ACQ9MH_18505 [Nitrospinales bacterium]